MNTHDWLVLFFSTGLLSGLLLGHALRGGAGKDGEQP